MQTTLVRQDSAKETPVTAESRGAFPPPNGNGNGNRALLEALAGSKFYHDYERAFSEATGLPVALRPVESWQLPLHGKRHEGTWCALMASKSRSCANCLQVQEQLAHNSAKEVSTITCGA